MASLRTYHFADLPTKEKKLRLLLDWATNTVLSKKRDITKLNTFTETDEKKLESSQALKNYRIGFEGFA